MAVYQQTKTIIDIGTNFIKMLQLKGGGRIYKYAIEKLPEGCIKGLNIEAEEPLIKALRSAKHKSGIPGGRCVLTLAGKDMIVRQPEKQLYQNVLLEMAGYLPVDSEKHAIDYKILEEVREDGNTLYRIMVATIHKRILERFSHVLKNAGFHIKVLDANENAQEKLFRALSKKLLADDENKGICIIDMGADTTKVNLFYQKRFFAGYLLNKGGNGITKLIQQHLETDTITAENYKLKMDFFKDEKVKQLLRAAVKNEIDSLIYELSKVADYFWTRTSEQLSLIVLSGGASLLNGLFEYLGTSIKVPVIKAQDILENFTMKKNFPQNAYPLLFNAYAASFREE